MLKKFSLFFVAIFAVILISIFIIYHENSKEPENKNYDNTGSFYTLKGSNQDNNSINDNTSKEQEIITPRANGGEYGGNSGSGSSGDSGSLPSNSSENQSFILDPNLPCGHYFIEKGICSGKCLKGTCINEGDSCYCKIV